MAVDNISPAKAKKDADIAYLKQHLGVGEAALEMVRMKLILMDTKSMVGVDILEEKPENFNEVVVQYKLWEALKS